MTTGNSAKKILMFSLPLLAGTVFQQFYSMVDSIIVGRYVGTQAFAAVGSTGSITFFVLGLVFGACSGFAIPVAQDFGAGDEAGVRRCVANIIYVCAAIAVVVSVVTALFTREILVLMDTQPAMMQDAYDYLFWIFVGIGAQMMYNMLAGIMRSLGDSRTPLIFLIISSLLNVVLDILLVKTLAIGVKGAAIATVIAQLISGILCLGFIAKKYPILHLTLEDMKIHFPTVRRLLGIGLPMGLQFSLTAIGAIVLQRSVNGLDANAVASVSAAGKVQNLIVAPMDAFGVSVATFVGQNYGAGRIDRIRKGVVQAYGMLLVCAVVGFGLNLVGSDAIATLFIDAGEVQILSQVRQFLICNGLFYPVLGLIHALRNTLQGVGYSKAAMLAGAFELVARAVMGMFIVPAFGFIAVCFAHPVAWIMAIVLLLPLYIVAMRRLKNEMPVRTAEA